MPYDFRSLFNKQVGGRDSLILSNFASIYVGTHVPQQECRGQKTTFTSWLSPSTMWVLETEFRPSSLVASVLRHWTVSPSSKSLLNICVYTPELMMITIWVTEASSFSGQWTANVQTHNCSNDSKQVTVDCWDINRISTLPLWGPGNIIKKEKNVCMM